jgi:hypothetical protein
LERSLSVPGLLDTPAEVWEQMIAHENERGEKQSREDTFSELRAEFKKGRRRIA